MTVHRTIASIEANFAIENMIFDEPCRNRVRAVLACEKSTSEVIKELNDKYKEYNTAPEDMQPDRSYCYPETEVLYNKFGIMDENILAEAERDFSSVRQAEFYLGSQIGDFSLKYLCDIHRQLFQDVYPWAGQIRNVDIAKGTCFCLVQYIDSQFDYVHKKLRKEKYLTEVTDREELACKLAYYLGEINVIHPFREGNGRSQRIFIEQLCNHNGRYLIDYSGITAEEMVRGSINSAIGDNKLLEELISRNLIKNTKFSIDFVNEFC